jgi:hypothetical protein
VALSIDTAIALPTKLQLVNPDLNENIYDLIEAAESTARHRTPQMTPELT